MNFSRNLKVDRIKAIVTEEINVFASFYKVTYEFYHKDKKVLSFTKAVKTNEFENLIIELINCDLLNLDSIPLDILSEMDVIELESVVDINNIMICNYDDTYILQAKSYSTVSFMTVIYDKDILRQIIYQLI